MGRLLPNQVAKYISAEGKEVEIGQTGELLVKGPNVFKGYLNNPEATRKALTLDGYFKTGDIGYQDTEGNFFITDRVKEVIKYKGFQIAPAELEGLLVTHPKIADAVVIGIYESRIASEVPRAFVVPTTGVETDNTLERDILSWVETKVANHKKLRGGLQFVNSVPRSASGKILRRLIRISTQEEDTTSKVKGRV